MHAWTFKPRVSIAWTILDSRLVGVIENLYEFELMNLIFF
jgi:hypothetical protein